MTIENILEKINNGEITPEAGLSQIKELKARKSSQEKRKPNPIQLVSTRNHKKVNTRIKENGKIVLKTHTEKSSKTMQYQDSDIAVIGMSGRFPGADNIESLWENIKNGVNSVTDANEKRWNMADCFDVDEKISGKAYSKYAGLMENIDLFDPLFFQISPMEAEIMDPQQRIFLEESWKVLEDAGYSNQELSGKKCGVFVGAASGDYRKRVEKSDAKGSAESFIGSSASILSGRIAYFLNLTGPCITVDTACSSSLVAIHYACQSIERGECEMAVAGGVSVMTTPELQIQTSQMGILSPSGVIKSFDQSADGTVMSEGVAAVVLKQASKAILDGDHIYGVIKATGVNQDGRTNGITAPNALAQAELEKEVYKKAGIHAADITMVEAHATGTKLGDPIEVKGLTAAFREDTDKMQFCSLGSIKANIGHTTMAAGVSGLIKVLLSMKYKKIPPLANFSSANEVIPFDRSPFYICKKLKDWDTIPGRKRLAAVSSFGFSGTNAHLVVEEYTSDKIKKSTRPYYLMAISAKTEEALEEKTAQLIKWLETEKEADMLDISYTLLCGRSHFACRKAFIVTDKNDFLTQLKNGTKNRTDGQIKQKSRPSGIVRLAQEYLSGIVPDFSQEFKGLRVQRISMPVYPFAKEHFWIETKPAQELKKAKEVHAFTKLLHKKGEEVVLAVTLLRDEFYLSDHCVFRSNVLPGVAHLEIAREACEKAFGKKVKRLENIVWMNPIEVKEPVFSAEIQILKKEGRMEFRIYSKEETIVFSQGEIYLEGEEPQPLSIKEIQERLNEMLDGEECYQRFHERNLQLGEGFHTIQYLYHNENESLAFLRMPEKLDAHFEDYVLHPSFMDGVLEAVVGFSDQDPEQKKMLELPFCMNRVTIYGKIPRECYSYARKKFVSMETGLKRYDVTMLDVNGNVIVDISGFSSRPVPEDMLTVKKADKVIEKDDGSYEETYIHWDWKKEELLGGQKEQVEPYTILLFDKKDGEFYKRVLCWQQEKPEIRKVFLVTEGTEFKNSSFQSFEVRAEWKEDYERLFDCLKQEQLLPDCIIHNWCEKGETLDVDLKHGIYSVFQLSQTWIQKKLSKKVSLIFLTEGKRECSNPLFSAMDSFLSVVNAESMKLVCHMIMFYPEMDADSKWKCLFNESTSSDTLKVFFENTKERYAWRPFLVEPPAVPKVIPLLRINGVFLITGGLGSLGFLFARYLVIKVKARLILAGRSVLDAKGRQKLNELKSLGGEVIYVRTDVTDRLSVKNLIMAAKNRFHEINGIFHCAGILRDSLIIGKEWKEFNMVLGPKIYGAAYLDEETKDENLDFFLLFSSVSPEIGLAGQGDYSYANGYLNYFAKERDYKKQLGERRGKTISIGWPLWIDGGMGKDEKSLGMHIIDSFRERFGVICMDEKSGIKCFEAVLSQSYWSIVPMYCHREILFPIIGLSKKQENEMIYSLSQKKQGENLEIYILEELKEAASKLLRMEKESIQEDKILTEYGFNSIILTSFTNQLNSQFHLSLTPAVFFEYTTLRKMACFLNEEFSQQFNVYFEEKGYIKEQKKEFSTIGIRSLMLDDVKKIMREVLGVQDKFILEDAQLSEYGLTSVTMTDFTQKMNQTWKVRLTPALFYEYTTISSFTDYLLKEYRKELEEYYHLAGARQLEQAEPASKYASLPVEAFNESQNISQESIRKADTVENVTNEPVAIVGMSAVMPDSDNLEDFWNGLLNGKDFIEIIPEERWRWQDYYGEVTEPDKSNVIYGSFIRNADKFDAAFFGISEEEADLMDPQQRVILQIVWKTIEDAGYRVSDSKMSKTGVFIGAAGADYLDAMDRNHIPAESYTTTGVSHCILANRISYLFNLRGPSEPIDTACSSSLVAIHRAIGSIRAGECEMAIAGGVNVHSSPLCFLSFAKKGMLSPDGKCKTFDRAADGYVRGEGAGAVLLKPLSKAEADGDHIYAVIKGSAVNHGGYVSTLTAPNPVAQIEVIEEAVKKAGVSPDTISYIETHGTGTSLGDQIEVYALKKAYQSMEKEFGCEHKTGYCMLGALKSNIGHLETAAGIASLVKVLLAFKHHIIPANTNFKDENPFLGLDGSQFHLVKQNEAWEPMLDKTGNLIPRRAGISSFGFGGVNAHIIVEEYLKKEEEGKSSNIGMQVVVLSAKTKESLQGYAKELADYLKKEGGAVSENSTLTLEKEEVTAALNKYLSKMLQVEPEELEGISLEEALGFERYPCVKFLEWLHETYQLDILPQQLDTGQTLEELAEMIIVQKSSDCNNIPTTLNFADIVYTLQCGREEMNERLAVVTDSVNGLWSLLQKYCNGEKSPFIYTETIGEEREIEKEAITDWSDAESVAEKWVSGVKADWAAHQNSISGRRISLPAYCFKKESHGYQKKISVEKRNMRSGSSQAEPVAIVGMSGVFPRSKDIEELWENIISKKELVTEIPKERWNVEKYYSENGTEKMQTNCKYGAFLSDLGCFDEEFFHILPKESKYMDPQQKIMLELAWSAMEDSGYIKEQLNGRKAGVFIGAQSSNYQDRIPDEELDNPYLVTGNSLSMLSNRISYLFNLTGPSEVIDTACSSSAVAVHRAVMAIQSGECEMSFAGGINIMLSPRAYVSTGKLGVLSPDGVCRTFDKNANGYVKGEGAGMLLLKPLSKALADKDHIHAVIRGSAENHGGKASALTAPNTLAQMEVVVDAYKNAGISFDTVTYIETHGTGTVLGDPVEIEALKKAFQKLQGEHKFQKAVCGLGTVKTNIGHLEQASGIAGIIKTVLSMKHKTLPEILHFEEQNPYIQLKNSPFYLVTKTQEWKQITDENGNLLPRRAGVSSFGIGGTNVHLVLEEVENQMLDEIDAGGQQLIVLSAKSKERLQVYANHLLSFLKTKEGKALRLQDIAYTLQTGREQMEERLAMIVSEKEELIQGLSTYAEGGQLDSGFYMSAKLDESQKKKRMQEKYVLEGKENISLEELADIWVSGTTICWKDVYDKRQGKKVSLPTYPFAGKKNLLKLSRKEESETDFLNETMFYKEEWEATEISLKSTVQEQCLVFWPFEIDKEMMKEKRNIIFIFPGTDYEKVSDFAYRINTTRETDYIRLIEDWKQNRVSTAKIVHAWSLKGGDDLCHNLSSYLETSVYSVFYLVKALFLSKLEEDVRLIYAYDNKQESATVYGAQAGMLRTFHQENPAFIGKMTGVDIESLNKEQVMDYVLDELNKNVGYETEVIYETDGRKEKKIVPVCLLKKVTDSPELLEGAVYLLTGGNGKIGNIIANAIAEKQRVQLVLTGRLPYQESMEQEWMEIREKGSKVVYVQADVGSLEDMKHVVEFVHQKFGTIRGVFHCAGCFENGFAIRKTLGQMQKVLKPKVSGTVYLDEVLQSEPLDFFVLFSSLSAVYGKAGQCDYAYANSYLDCFARLRNKKVKSGTRFGKTISINWPFWKEGGMHTSKEEEMALEKQLGLSSIPAGKAVSALNKIMSAPEGQYMVLYGNRNKIQENMEQFNQKEDKEEKGEHTEQKISLEMLRRKTAQFLKNLILEETGIEKEMLTEETGFDEIGLDSILVNHFNSKMSEIFGEIPKTLLYEYNTVADLVSYLVRNQREKLVQILFHTDETEIQVERSLALKEQASEQRKNESVAIIGISGRYPEANNLNEFWDCLKNGKDCIGEIPDGRWDMKQYYDSDFKHPKQGKMYCKWGGFLRNVEQFDPLFFQIAPSDAHRLDPQVRLFLETVWETMKDGGYAVSLPTKESRNIGVFAAVTTNSYQLWAPQEWEKGNYIMPDSTPWSVANRVSYVFNFNGPSMPVDTACASGITAIHLACESLKNGECEMAIAGGVNLYLHPYKYVTMCQAKMLSPTGKCHSFGADADGFVPGEGVGAVLLKPLSQAEKDGDFIYGVIKGTAVNHGGRTSGFTVPNPNREADVIAAAMKEAGTSPETISYIEAHGTGTPLGDPIEFSGLNQVFGLAEKQKMYCAVGSVKANIGHLEAASGIAGLTKVLLQMKHKMLVPSIHSEQLNQDIAWKDSVFYVPQKAEPWQRPIVVQNGNRIEVPRRAGISSFGAGGANAHMIVEEYENRQSRKQRQMENLSNPVKKKRFWIPITNEQSKEDPYLKLFYEVKWYKEPLLEKNISVAVESRKILIVYSKDGLALKNALCSIQKENVIYEIELGSQYQRKSGRQYEIRKESAKDVETVLQEMGRPDVIYMIAVSDKNEKAEDWGRLEEKRNISVMAVFRLLKAMEELKTEDSVVELKVITNCTQKVGKNDTVNPAFTGMIGLVQSVVKEYDWLKTSCIDFEMADILEGGAFTYAKCAVEEKTAENGTMAAYRAGIRYVKKLVSIQLPVLEKNPYKDHGVYVIIGGLGSIGYDLACYLSEKVHGKLVLAGRSLLDAKKEEQLENIRSKGGMAEYVQADLNQEESLTHLMAETKRRFGKITGVIHSAMVYSDLSFKEMTEQTFIETIEPKEKGCMVLGRVLEKEDIDFLLLFSSGQTYAASARRGHYAAACYYEDAYALALSEKADYKVKLVNWGYWGSIRGKELGEISPAYQKSLEDQGILPMSSSYGMEALKRMMGNERTQIYTFHVKDYVLRMLGVSTSDEMELQPEKVKFSKRKVQEFVKEKIMEGMENILEVERDEIKEEQAFMDMGVDSILGSRLIEYLNQSLNITAKVSDIFEYYSITLLADYLVTKFYDIVSEQVDKLEVLSETKLDKEDAEELFRKLYRKEITVEEVYKYLEEDTSWLMKVD